MGNVLRRAKIGIYLDERLFVSLMVCHAISQFWLIFQTLFQNDLELVVNMKNWSVFANELNVSVIAICGVSEMTKMTYFLHKKHVFWRL